MTDNDKMREVWDAHDKARNKAWREEPGTFDTLDAFKAGAAWQAANSVPDAELEQLRKDAERYRKALVSIAEYWNADRNDEAMHDACWYAINTASDALGDGRMSAYFYSPDYYRDNREHYGGEWVAKYADGTEIPINCGKDKNIFFYAGDYVKKHGKCTGLLRIDAAIAGEKK